MTKRNGIDRRGVGAGLIAAGALAMSRPAQAAAPTHDEVVKKFAALPDWTGIWMSVGTTLFEQSAGARSLNANDPNAGWDGKINGKIADMDVYVYIVELYCDNANIVPYKGNVALIR